MTCKHDWQNFNMLHVYKSVKFPEMRKKKKRKLQLFLIMFFHYGIWMICVTNISFLLIYLQSDRNSMIIYKCTFCHSESIVKSKDEDGWMSYERWMRGSKVYIRNILEALTNENIYMDPGCFFPFFLFSFFFPICLFQAAPFIQCMRLLSCSTEYMNFISSRFFQVSNSMLKKIISMRF